MRKMTSNESDDLDEIIYKMLKGNPLFNSEIKKEIKERGMEASENRVDRSLKGLMVRNKIKSFPKKRGGKIRVIYFCPEDENKAKERYFREIGEEELINDLKKYERVKNDIEEIYKIHLLYKEEERRDREGKHKSKEVAYKISFFRELKYNIPIVMLDGVFFTDIREDALLPYIPKENTFYFIGSIEQKHILPYVSEYSELKALFEEFGELSRKFWQKKKELNDELDGRVTWVKWENLDSLNYNRKYDEKAQKRYIVYKHLMQKAGYSPDVFESSNRARKSINGGYYTVSRSPVLMNIMSRSEFVIRERLDSNLDAVGSLLIKLLEYKHKIIGMLDGIISSLSNYDDKK